jgi:hypothetical protein
MMAPDLDSALVHLNIADNTPVVHFRVTCAV